MEVAFSLVYGFTVFVLKTIFKIRVGIPGLNLNPSFVFQKPFGTYGWKPFG